LSKYARHLLEGVEVRFERRQRQFEKLQFLGARILFVFDASPFALWGRRRRPLVAGNRGRRPAIV